LEKVRGGLVTSISGEYAYDPEVLRLLGLSTVEFSSLEMYVRFGITLILFDGSGASQKRVEEITANLSFAAKTDLFSRLYYSEYGAEAAVADGVAEVCACMDKVRVMRNALHHSGWLPSLAKGARCIATRHTRKGATRQIIDVTAASLRAEVSAIIGARDALVQLIDDRLRTRCSG
jgi:hypothetical protein